MVATLLAQLADRKREVVSGHLAGQELKSQHEHLKKLITGLKEKVEKLKDAPDADKREEYVKKVDVAYAELESAKPAHQPTVDQKEEAQTKKVEEAKAQQEEKDAEEAKEAAVAAHEAAEAKAHEAAEAAKVAATEAKTAETHAHTKKAKK